MIQKYASAFKEKLEPTDRIRAPPVRIRIDPAKDVAPKAHSRTYDVPYNLRKPMQAEISDAIHAGVLTPCNTPSKWVHQMFPVPKAGKNEVRLCSDFKRLNSAIERPVYPTESNSQILRHVPPDSK